MATTNYPGIIECGDAFKVEKAGRYRNNGDKFRQTKGQGMDERPYSALRKEALAERGVGGEKDTAAKMLQKM